MDPAYSMLLYHLIMLFCAITFVLFKAVLRIFLGVFQHQPISGNFGDNGRGGDGKNLRVSIDN